MLSSSHHRASVSSFRPLPRHHPSLLSNMALICSLKSATQASAPQAASPLISPQCWFKQELNLNSSLPSQSSSRPRLRPSPNWLKSRFRHSLKLNQHRSHSPSKSKRSLCSSSRSPPRARKASVPAGSHPSRASLVFESSYLPLLERGRAFR